ncbi:hypothetical protein [Candidatus Poriferisodalis sp.]|uniref:hypothetical protein n=1 Tax=Candidatus Poriferisodalis sp. TaxID=3101277 RepID=UPI003D107150
MEANLHEEWIEALGEASEPEFEALLGADDRLLRNLMSVPQSRFDAQSSIRQQIKQRRDAQRTA